MFEGNLKGYRIGQRNEVYPPGIGEGYPGYDYYHALQMKQTQETLDLAPADRTDIIEQCKARLAVLSEFAPEEMSEDAIRAVIQEVIASLGIEKPEGKDKGKIMKELMPKVKGKADGALVNKLVGETLA